MKGFIFQSNSLFMSSIFLTRHVLFLRTYSPLVTQRRVSQERLYLTPPPTTTYQKPLAQLTYISSSPSPNGGRGRARSLDSPRALMEPSRVPLQLHAVEKPKPTVFAPWAPQQR